MVRFSGLDRAADGASVRISNGGASRDQRADELRSDCGSGGRSASHRGGRTVQHQSEGVGQVVELLVVPKGVSTMIMAGAPTRAPVIITVVKARTCLPADPRAEVVAARTKRWRTYLLGYWVV